MVLILILNHNNIDSESGTLSSLVYTDHCTVFHAEPRSIAYTIHVQPTSIHCFTDSKAAFTGYAYMYGGGGGLQAPRPTEEAQQY